MFKMVIMLFQTDIKTQQGGEQNKEPATTDKIVVNPEPASSASMPIIIEQPPKTNYKLLFLAAIIILAVVSAFLYVNYNHLNYTSNNPNTKSTILTTIISSSPAQNLTPNTTIKSYSANALINSSSVLFGVPDSDLFVESYAKRISTPPNLGISTAYGMNFMDEIINYSSTASAFSYNVSIPSAYLYSNSPLAVTIVLWKSKTISNSTSRYLQLLRDSLGESYNYTHHLNVLNYSNRLGTITYSPVSVYYINNGTVVNATGLYSNSLSEYLSGFLTPYSSNINISAAPSFSTEIFPVYKSLEQSQVAFIYNDYVVSVYAWGVLGTYNTNYTDMIAKHLFTLLKSNNYDYPASTWPN